MTKQERAKRYVEFIMLVEGFGEAAKYYGWQEDQGTGDEPAKAKKGNDESKEDLLKWGREMLGVKE